MRDKNREKLAGSSRRFFVSGMQGHNAVANITNLGNDKYLINRTNGSPLTVLVADIYIAGEAEIHEINPSANGIDCIVLIGFYNRYSWHAKQLAKSMGVALFDNREFFAAINFNDDKFMEYEKKAKKDD